MKEFQNLVYTVISCIYETDSKANLPLLGMSAMISVAAFNAVPNLFCIYHRLQYSVLQIKIYLFMGHGFIDSFCLSMVTSGN